MSRIQEELRAVVVWITAQDHDLLHPENRRARAALGCLDLAIEHQTAISLLAAQNLWGPVYALLSRLLDAFVRGVWLARCASEDDLDAFQLAGLRGRSFEDLVGDVERSLGHSRGVLSKLRHTSWAMFGDFTYGASAGPNYPAAETDQALRVATALGLLAATERADLAGHRDVALRCKQRTRRFAELTGS
jgi:hypothetical protein